MFAEMIGKGATGKSVKESQYKLKMEELWDQYLNPQDRTCLIYKELGLPTYREEFEPIVKEATARGLPCAKCEKLIKPESGSSLIGYYAGEKGDPLCNPCYKSWRESLSIWQKIKGWFR